MNAHKAILIVDDEFLNRFLLRKYLSDLDFTLAEAENGEEALDWLKNTTFAEIIILLDLNMPAMDGFDFIKYLESNHAEFHNQQIEIIIVSASEYSVFQEKLPEAKIVDYLRKPSSKTAVQHSIQKALENFK